jgi:purine operon repressor
MSGGNRIRRRASLPDALAAEADAATGHSRGERGERAERLAGVAMRLLCSPGAHHTLDELASPYAVARSTASDDILTLDRLALGQGIGRIEAVPGRGGGVRFLPGATGSVARDTVASFAGAVCDPARVLPGGFLYLTDLVCSPDWSSRLGAVFAGVMRQAEPTHVLTVETRGIPIALMTAHKLGLPLLIARRDARVTEGPALSITYLSATTGSIQNMSLPRRALRTGARVLIIDDFMRGGGTAKGLTDLVAEFDAVVAGIGMAIVTGIPADKRVGRFLPLAVLSRVDEGSRWVEVEPNLDLQWFAGRRSGD